MEFIQYALHWCKGEIFEGKMFALFGVVVLTIAGLYWKYGLTSFSKAMIIPFLVLGLFCTSGGIGVVYNNQQRLVQFQEKYERDSMSFIQTEKVRIETFLKRYPYTMWGMAGVILIGLCCFFLWAGSYGRSVGLTLMIFGLSILFLDHFSEERAKNYHHVIVNYLSENEGDK